MEFETTIRKATLGFKKDGSQYLAGKITSSKLTELINKKVKITIEVVI